VVLNSLKSLNRASHRKCTLTGPISSSFAHNSDVYLWCVFIDVLFYRGSGFIDKPK
jgi:hypothetical protein